MTETVKVTVQYSDKHPQFRLTLPIWIVRSLELKAGDKMKPSISRGKVCFRRVKK